MRIVLGFQRKSFDKSYGRNEKKWTIHTRREKLRSLVSTSFLGYWCKSSRNHVAVTKLGLSLTAWREIRSETTREDSLFVIICYPNGTWLSPSTGWPMKEITRDKRFISKRRFGILVSKSGKIIDDESKRSRNSCECHNVEKGVLAEFYNTPAYTQRGKVPGRRNLIERKG